MAASLETRYAPPTAESLRALHGRLADRAASADSFDAFCAAFLDDVVRTLGVVGGAVWRSDERGLRPAATVGVGPDDLDARRPAAERVLHTGVGTAGPHPSPGSPEALFYPVRIGTTPCGVVMLILPNDLPRAEQASLRRALVPLCDFVAEFVFRGAQDARRNGDSSADDAAEFALRVHASLDTVRCAATIAEELRRLVDCDRVSACVVHHRQARAAAFSGQDYFDPRSNLVRRLEALAGAVAASGEPLVYPSPAERLPPQIEAPLHAYVDQSQARRLIVVPLRETDGRTGDDGPGDVIGVVAAERISPGTGDAGWMRRLEPLLPHAAVALTNCRRCDLGPFRFFLRSVRAVASLTAARNLPKTAIGVGALVALFAILFFVPCDFAVEARGTLQPVVRRDVFAAADGTIDKILVRTGDRVAQGDVLFELRNNELDVAEADLIKQINENEQELLNAQRAYNEGNRTLTPTEQNRLLGQIAVFETRRESLRRQAQLFAQKREQLKVRSPLTGQIATWNVVELLTERPVRRGQTLASLVDPAGEWEIEIRVPEDRFGHVAEARRDGAAPAVAFVAATDPGREYQGVVRELHLAAEPRGEEGNVVLVRAAIDKRQLAHLQTGADVRVRIDCGTRSLAYVLLGDVWAFVQSRILFKL